MLPIKDYLHNETRRQFFGKAALGLGTAALSTLMSPAISESIASESNKSILKSPHNPPKAKRAIYLFMAGAPSQLDLFDYKPKMVDWFDKELPESVRQGQRLTTMTSGQSRFPIAPSVYKFKKYDNGADGAWVSELLPYHSTMVSDLAIIKTVHTEAINHDPAITYICTGDQCGNQRVPQSVWDP